MVASGKASYISMEGIKYSSLHLPEFWKYSNSMVKLEGVRKDLLL